MARATVTPHNGSATPAPPMSRLPVLALCCLLACSSAFPQESATLRKIRQAGVVSIGYREASVPFSYLDERLRPSGYSIAICAHLVDAVRMRLGLRHLERRYVPVNSATRIPMVVNGSVDLECGVTTNTLERQKLVAFSVTTFVAASRLASKKATPTQAHAAEAAGEEQLALPPPEHGVRGAGVRAEAVFQLEAGLEAAAQVFRALEADARRVVGEFGAVGRAPLLALEREVRASVQSDG